MDMTTFWSSALDQLSKCRSAAQQASNMPWETEGETDSPAPGIGRVRPDVDVVLLVGDEAHLAQVHGLVAAVEADVALPASKGFIYKIRLIRF